MEIGEPTLLAKLSRAGLSEEGSRWFSQVQGVREGKSRKRNEICAAVDGNALNILEVVNGRNLVSWPVAPDSSFVSTPYAEKVYIDEKSSVRRCWCAVRRRNHLAIQNFEQGKVGSSLTSRTTTYALKKSQAPVIRIEPVTGTERAIVVAQEDGTITILSSEGAEISHSCRLTGDSSAVKLLAVQPMSVGDAQRSVLKSRPDIAASLSYDNVVIAAVRQSRDSPTGTGEVQLELWTLSLSSTGSQRLTASPLVQYSLRHGSNTNLTSKVVATFKSSSTKLALAVASTITTFDLTLPIPLKLGERRLLTGDQLAAVDLYNDIELVFAPGKLEIYNTKFDSLLASMQLGGGGLKRKRDVPNLTRMSFLAYFSHLRRIIAHSGSQLLAIDIHSATERNTFKQSSLLIGNVLRGSVDKSVSSQAKADTTPNDEWKETRLELDRLASQHDSPGFEVKAKEVYGLQTWTDMKELDAEQVDFMLSKMFISEDRELKLAIFPPKIFEWCVKNGYINIHRICQALRMSPTSFDESSLCKCLSEVREQPNVLELYVRSAPSVQPSILTAVVKSILGRAIGTREEGQVVETSLDQDAIGFNRADGLTSTDVLTQGNSLAQSLVYALQRLAFAGDVTVSGQLRASLEKAEVLALVQFLRQQLFLGGYTRLAEARNYPTPPASSTDIDGDGDNQHDGSSQISLEGIVVLLNGCIDCLGVVGMLGTTEDQEFIERMVSELRSEIENATTAVTDAVYLQGLLRETLRYVESVERQPFEVQKQVEMTSGVQGERGKVVTIYSESDTANAGAQMPTGLPLSLKAGEDLSLQKTQKGGQLTSRSVREMGMLKDRLKAPYSFEVLML